MTFICNCASHQQTAARKAKGVNSILLGCASHWSWLYVLPQPHIWVTHQSK